MSLLDKTPLRSKKFIALLISNLIIAGIMIIALATQLFNWEMVLMMCIGMFGIVFQSTGYVLSQAALDKLVQGISHISGAAKNVTDIK